MRHRSQAARRPDVEARCADDWRAALPVLRDSGVTLRSLEPGDAATLWTHLGNPSCCRFMERSPASLAQLRRFVEWSSEQRRSGRLVCYGAVPAGHTKPVGLLQIWPIQSGFATAEWGFVIGEAYWGTGLFGRSAALLLDFAFGALGVRRLEARAVDRNQPANAALRRLGATREGVLRGGFFDGTRTLDQVMWSLLSSEWRARAAADHRGHDAPR